MFGKLRKGRGEARAVEFCESCGQVCTAGCRAEARRERTQVEALYRLGPMR
jgi:hypothetical protein